MAASPAGRRPPASREAGLSRLSPSAEPGRARPSAAEPGRTACPSRRRRRPASERPRGGGGAPGEEAPARRRPPAAEATGSRRGGSGRRRRRGRGGGSGEGNVAPTRLPHRPPAGSEPRSAPSISLPRTLRRARTGLRSGSGL
ncbi:adropin isoform X1 [Myotis daubentonii]|uniref:adropin isoform X1 n=1 Tax=Myotis daubentonii TaxID=98922 RepID=UPI002873567A|nr:adropin isoform X1 [Myotis daubentonii]